MRIRLFLDHNNLTHQRVPTYAQAKRRGNDRRLAMQPGSRMLARELKAGSARWRGVAMPAAGPLAERAAAPGPAPCAALAGGAASLGRSALGWSGRQARLFKIFWGKVENFRGGKIEDKGGIEKGGNFVPPSFLNFFCLIK